MGLIYCATNQVNGKRYIGLTSRTLEERKREHLRASYYRDKVFYCDLNEYPDKFDWEVLEEIEDDSQLYVRELHYINYYKHELNETLYNIQQGSESKFKRQVVKSVQLKGVTSVTSEIKERIVKGYQEGKYIREISRETGINKEAVKQVLIDEDVFIRQKNYKYSYQDALSVKELILEGQMNLSSISETLGFSKDFVNGVYHGRYYDIVTDTDRQTYQNIPKTLNSEISNRKSVTKSKAIEIVTYIINHYHKERAKDIGNRFNISERLVYNVANGYCWKDIWKYFEVHKGVKHSEWKLSVNKR